MQPAVLSPDLTIETVDLRIITGDMAQRLNGFWNTIRKEYLPEDPPTPLEENLQGWHNLPESDVDQVWVVWDEHHRDLIATLYTEYWLTPDNQHLLYFEINVSRGCRRQGLARRLLPLAAQTAQQNNRRLMMAETCSNIPAGVAFLERLGAQRGLETHTNQVQIAEIDHALMARWRANLDGRLKLDFWLDRYPDDQIDGVLELFKIVNDEPHDDLEIEDRQYTEELLRQWEQYQHARGVERWTIYATEPTTGRFCGFSEVFWNPNKPTILQQGFTGVNPDYRGMGLGRALKAFMLEKVLRDRPEATIIRTGNANSNRFMLAINQEMGFKPYIAWTYWQIDTQKVFEYL